jgi:hypothetical protein
MPAPVRDDSKLVPLHEPIGDMPDDGSEYNLVVRVQVLLQRCGRSAG